MLSAIQNVWIAIVKVSHGKGLNHRNMAAPYLKKEKNYHQNCWPNLRPYSHGIFRYTMHDQLDCFQKCLDCRLQGQGHVDCLDDL